VLYEEEISLIYLKPMSAPAPSCEIVGDPDLYGLGVRLVVYAQALAYLCALTYSKSPRMILEIPCLFSSVAINAVLFLRAFQGRLRPFDTMLALFTVGTLGVAAPLEENAEWERRGETRGGKVVTWMQTACMVSQLGFGSWAVMNDLRIDLTSNARYCSVWIYVFSKQINSGWALNVWKGFYLFAIGFLTLRWIWRRRIARMALCTVWQLCRDLVLRLRSLLFNSIPSERKITEQTEIPAPMDQIKPLLLSQPPLAHLPLNPEAHRTTTTPASAADNLNKIPTYLPPAKRPSTRPDTAALLAALFWTICFNALGAELMIYWNHVQGVHSLSSSGQILSLLGGSFALAQFIWVLSGLSLGSEG